MPLVYQIGTTNALRNPILEAPQWDLEALEAA